MDVRTTERQRIVIVRLVPLHFDLRMHVARLQQREAIDVGANRLGEAPQDLLAVLRLHAPPMPGLEAGARRRHRRIHVRGAAPRHLGDHPSVDRAHVVEDGAIERRDEAAADEGAPLGLYSGGEALPRSAVALQG